MADIPTLPVNVDSPPSAHVERIVLGAQGEAGQQLYLDGENGWKPAINTAAASAKGKCVLLGSGVLGTVYPSGAEVDAVFYGRVKGFSGLSPNGDVFTGGTAGKMDQTAPVAAGTHVFKIGYAWDATSIFVDPQKADPTANS